MTIMYTVDIRTIAKIMSKDAATAIQTCLFVAASALCDCRIEAVLYSWRFPTFKIDEDVYWPLARLPRILCLVASFSSLVVLCWTKTTKCPRTGTHINDAISSPVACSQYAE